VTITLTLILLLPLGGGLVNLLPARMLPRRIVAALAAGVSGGSFLCAVSLLAAYRKPVTVELFPRMMVFPAPLTLRLDSLALTLILTVTFVCGVIHLRSVRFPKEDPGHGRSVALLNFSLLALLILLLAENLPLFYLAGEGVSICFFLLTGLRRRGDENGSAGRKGVIVTGIGDILLGIALLWIFQLFSTISITEITTLGFLMPVGVLTGIGLLLLAGAAGKCAQFPLMIRFLPAAGGLSPQSTLLNAATMAVAGLYLMIRMMPLVERSPIVHAAVLFVGGMVATCTVVFALARFFPFRGERRMD
jgi:NADH-quinone oxidoreductase subunit L